MRAHTEASCPCWLHACSFTRTNKLQLWERVVASSGLASTDAHTAALTASGMAGPIHLQMLNCILMRAFNAYPEAAIVKYTFLVPPWLFGWSHKVCMGHLLGSASLPALPSRSQVLVFAHVRKRLCAHVHTPGCVHALTGKHAG